MRVALVCFVLFGYNVLIHGQNLVPNPSFEEVHNKPTSMLDSGHEFSRDCKFWKTANLASTDLITPRFRTNKFEAITPYAGKNMCGIVIHGDFWSEYLKIKLLEPTQSGVEYYVEFWIAYCQEYNKDDTPKYSNPHLGAYFGDDIFHKDEKIMQLPNQIASKNNIQLKDKIWTKISGSFIADGTYEYLYLGQFQGPNMGSNFLLGYYFLDEVSVVKFSDKSTVFSPKEYVPDGLNNIYFETDKYDLLPQSFSTLDKVVSYLRKNQSLKLDINGHTDSRGENYHNEELSQNRARSVNDYLVSNGISQSRLKWAGMGSSKPIATNDTEDGRQENRRVEFIASGAKIAKQALAEVSVAEADNVYEFSSELTGYQYNLIGKYKSIWNCQMEAQPGKGSSPFKDCTKKSAKSYVVEKAKDYPCVFLNDSKLHPQTRIFGKSLLKDLYDQGYRHLGVEAFTNFREVNAGLSCPSINSGSLSDEPLFGDMIREALSIGFKLFSFQPSETEIAKATNIIKKKYADGSQKDLKVSALNWSKAMNINRYTKAHPNEKFLIYTSKNQIAEKDVFDFNTLTQWFKNITSIDPLTIEQAIMNEACPENEHPHYKYAQVAGPTIFLKYKTPVVAKQNDIETPYDLQVFHPRTQYVQNRPDWLRMKGNRKPFKVNPDQYEMDYPLLAYAIKKGEDPQIAVPVDIVEFETNRIEMPLLLPPGEYQLVLRDKKIRKKFDILVD